MAQAHSLHAEVRMRHCGHAWLLRLLKEVAKVDELIRPVPACHRCRAEVWLRDFESEGHLWAHMSSMFCLTIS